MTTCPAQVITKMSHWKVSDIALCNKRSHSLLFDEITVSLLELFVDLPRILMRTDLQRELSAILFRGRAEGKKIIGLPVTKIARNRCARTYMARLYFFKLSNT